MLGHHMTIQDKWAGAREVAPGIHRIESDLGERSYCQYALVGRERTLLLDTGLAGAPDAAIEPYLRGIGLSLEAIDWVVISHADVDHCGGNARIRELNEGAVLACHELDRRWIEKNRAMLLENYAWHHAYGIGLPDDARTWLLDALGGDCPIDLGLRGGETIRLEPNWHVEVLNLPGHTRGHIGLWDPRSAVAIVIDAVLESGVCDRAGTLLIPPRIYDLDAYRRTIRLVRSLDSELLLTAHFPVMDGREARDFLDRSLGFTDELERVVRAAVASGITDLATLTERAVEQLGPYPEFPTELAASVRAVLHL
jgi:glyoxylase-like metal-dependent hydrolase (beta-lactamase superfamily II)